MGLMAMKDGISWLTVGDAYCEDQPIMVSSLISRDFSHYSMNAIMRSVE